jgi:hypothetical protein
VAYAEVDEERDYDKDYEVHREQKQGDSRCGRIIALDCDISQRGQGRNDDGCGDRSDVTEANAVKENDKGEWHDLPEGDAHRPAINRPVIGPQPEQRRCNGDSERYDCRNGKPVPSVHNSSVIPGKSGKRHDPAISKAKVVLPYRSLLLRTEGHQRSGDIPRRWPSRAFCADRAREWETSRSSLTAREGAVNAKRAGLCQLRDLLITTRRIGAVESRKTLSHQRRGTRRSSGVTPEHWRDHSCFACGKDCSPMLRGMSHFVARPEHLERALGGGETIEQLFARLDQDDGLIFLDDQGRLCFVEQPLPIYYEREEVVGAELERLCAHYGVADGDLSVVRGRMIVEGAWGPEEVLVENRRLFVFGDPDNKPLPEAEVQRAHWLFAITLSTLGEVDPAGISTASPDAYESLARAISVRLWGGEPISVGLIAGALDWAFGEVSDEDAARITAMIEQALREHS